MFFLGRGTPASRVPQTPGCSYPQRYYRSPPLRVPRARESANPAVVITGATTSRAGVPLITATGVGSARYCGAPRREKGPGCPNYLQKELRLTDGPAEHHVVVLVRQVVAVGHVVAEERAEPPEDAGLLAGRERNEVFLARVALVIELLALQAEEVDGPVGDVMLFHVEVHRVRPAATAVVDAPGLGSADEDGRERLGRVELRPVDQPLGLATQATALEGEVLARSDGLGAVVRLHAEGLLGGGHEAVVHRRVPDDELHHRDGEVGIEPDVALLRLLAAREHLGDVRQVHHGSRSDRAAVDVLREVDHDFAALGRPDLDGVLQDRVRKNAAAAGDLVGLHEQRALVGHLLASNDLAEVPLALLPRERHRGALPELQLVLTGDRGAEEAEAVPTGLDLENREGNAVDGEDVADEAVVRVVAVEQLAPVLGVHVAADDAREAGIRSDGGVVVRVGNHAVIGGEVVERHRDVVLDVERPVVVALGVDVVHADAGEAPAVGLGLVAVVELGIVVRRESDHALVDVRAGVVHAVVVVPEERLLLAVVTAGGVGHPEVVDPLHRTVAAFVVDHGVRLAIGLGSVVAVVAVREERPVRSAEVATVEAARVQVEVVLEPDDDRTAVLDVDHRARELSVEAVDRALRQVVRRNRRALEAGGAGRVDAGRADGQRGRIALRVDRNDRRAGERVTGHLQADVVQDRIRHIERDAAGARAANPLLVRAGVRNAPAELRVIARTIAERVLVARLGSRKDLAGAELRLTNVPRPRIALVGDDAALAIAPARTERFRNDESVGERLGDEGAGGERLSANATAREGDLANRNRRLIDARGGLRVRALADQRRGAAHGAQLDQLSPGKTVLVSHFGTPP